MATPRWERKRLHLTGPVFALFKQAARVIQPVLDGLKFPDMDEVERILGALTLDGQTQSVCRNLRVVARGENVSDDQMLLARSVYHESLDKFVGVMLGEKSKLQPVTSGRRKPGINETIWRFFADHPLKEE